MRFSQQDIDALLEAWPRLRRKPNLDTDVCSVAGPLAFSMSPTGLPTLEDSYVIRIDVPMSPTELAPRVYEEGGRIPRDIHHHVFDSGALCLGSRWTVRQKLGDPPSLIGLVEQCVVPFLYAASWREQGGVGYPFADLAHGGAGLLDDYECILGLTGSEAVADALHALTRRRREANKLRCPCGCQRRLGRCPYRLQLDVLRKGMSRSFFGGLRLQINQAYPRIKPVPRAPSG